MPRGLPLTWGTMGALVLKFSPMDLHEFLLSPVAYLAPEKTLDGLSPAHADRRIAGTSHSIAELVAHMSFWQDWFYSRCQGNAVPPAATAAQGWPAVTSGTWPDIRSRFVTRLNEIAKLAETNTSRPITPAIEFPPLAHYTIADALVHIATHNSHHLGQVITLRQIMGTWPPPAGSWTW